MGVWNGTVGSPEWKSDAEKLIVGPYTITRIADQRWVVTNTQTNEQVFQTPDPTETVRDAIQALGASDDVVPSSADLKQMQIWTGAVPSPEWRSDAEKFMVGSYTITRIADQRWAVTSTGEEVLFQTPEPTEAVRDAIQTAPGGFSRSGQSIEVYRGEPQRAIETLCWGVPDYPSCVPSAERVEEMGRETRRLSRPQRCTSGTKKECLDQALSRMRELPANTPLPGRDFDMKDLDSPQRELFRTRAQYLDLPDQQLQITRVGPSKWSANDGKTNTATEYDSPKAVVERVRDSLKQSGELWLDDLEEGEPPRESLCLSAPNFDECFGDEDELNAFDEWKELEELKQQPPYTCENDVEPLTSKSPRRTSPKQLLYFIIGATSNAAQCVNAGKLFEYWSEPEPGDSWLKGGECPMEQVHVWGEPQYTASGEPVMAPNEEKCPRFYKVPLPQFFISEQSKDFIQDQFRNNGQQAFRLVDRGVRAPVGLELGFHYVGQYTNPAEPIYDVERISTLAPAALPAFYY